MSTLPYRPGSPSLIEVASNSWVRREHGTGEYISVRGATVKGHLYKKLPQEARGKYDRALQSVMQTKEMQSYQLRPGALSSERVRFAFNSDGIEIISHTGARETLLSDEQFQKRFSGYKNRGYAHRFLGTKSRDAYHELFHQSMAAHTYVTNIQPSVHFYQHSPDQLSDIDQRVQHAFNRVRDDLTIPTKPATESWYRAIPAPVGDVAGIPRNIVAITTGSSSLVVLVGLVLAGVLSIWSGAVVIKRSCERIAGAKEVDDKKAENIAKFYQFIGWLSCGAGALFGANGIAALLSTKAGVVGAAGAAAGIGIAGNVGFSLVSLAAIIYGVKGYVDVAKVSTRMNSYLKNEELSEEERFRGVVADFKNQVSITHAKALEIWGQVCTDPEWKEESIENKRAEFDRRVELQIRKKRSRFASRTSPEAAEAVSRRSEKILQKIDNVLTKNEGIQEAKKLILEVKKANFKIKVIYICVVLAGLIGLTAAIVSFFNPTGGAILFAIALILWLSVDGPYVSRPWLGDKIGELMWWMIYFLKEPGKPIDLRLSLPHGPLIDLTHLFPGR